MKKLFSIIAAVLAVTVWCVMPAMAAKIDVGGEMRARGYIVQGDQAIKDNNKNWLDARFRLDAKIQQGMTTGVIQADFLGNTSSLSSTTPDVGDAVSNNGNLVLGNATGNSYDLVGVRQAYLVVNFPVLNVIGGRYEVKLGNGLILNDTSDLVAVTAPVGAVNLLVGYLVLGENDAPLGGAHSTSTGSDDTAFAINAGMKDVGGSGFGGNVFFVSAHAPVSYGFTTKDKTQLYVIGLTGDGKVGPANVNAELDILSGTACKKTTTGTCLTNDSNFKGTNFLVSGGLPAESVGLPVGLNAAIIYASGQSSTSKDTNVNAIDGDFRASNILVRNDFNNYEGLSNIGMASGQNLGLKAVKVAATLPKLGMGGMTHTPEIGLVWAQTAEKSTISDKSDIGTEIYANTNCVFDPNLSGNVGLGYLAAGHALDQSATKKAENQVKLEASLTFHF